MVENSEPAIACSLSQTDLHARLEAWRALSDEALLDHTSEANGFSLSWRATASVRDRLATLIEAEQECCPFLKFELHEGDGLVLRITGPVGYGDASTLLLSGGLGPR